MTNGRPAGGNGTGEEPQDPAARRAAMRAVNPAFIPRNHRIEAVIEAAVNRDDFAPFEEFLTVLSRPYEDQPAFAAYAEPPSRTSACCRRFAGRRIVNPASTIRRGAGAHRAEINKRSIAFPTNLTF